MILIILILIIILFIIFNLSSFSIFGYTDIEDSYKEPYILEKILTKEECDMLINYSKNKLFDSHVVGGKNSSIRNSKQTWISKDDEIIDNILNRICKIVNLSRDKAEDLQIVNYKPGTYYKHHHDACCEDNTDCKEFLKRGGQRQLTVLIYLNSDYEGGYTDFPNLNKQFKLEPGDAVVFYPLATGTNICHPKALHAGMPVTKGEKWIANLWFRVSKFI